MSEKVRVFRAVDVGGLRGGSPSVMSPPRVGVVAAVDRDKGELVLVQRGGVRSCLRAAPSLLNNVRPWGVVLVVTEGTAVRMLRCL